MSDTRDVKDQPAPQEEEDGGAIWVRIIADPRPRPKLEVYAKASIAEGVEDMDLEKLKPENWPSEEAQSET